MNTLNDLVALIEILPRLPDESWPAWITRAYREGLIEAVEHSRAATLMKLHGYAFRTPILPMP